MIFIGEIFLASFLLKDLLLSVNGFPVFHIHTSKRATATTRLFAGSEPSRRRDFCSIVSTGLLLVSTTSELARAADDRLFRPNPLTNPVLEQIRIWEQAEADELKYGGELERGDAGNNGQVEAYPKLLVPILQISQDLTKVDEIVHQDDREQWKQAQTILAQPKYEKVNFKKIFNRFGDNIYYSDPDRANFYLGGGATPKSEQSLAYLLRNQILTSIEDMQAELNYLEKNPQEDPNELRRLSETARTAMERYLKVVPPNEIADAKKQLLSAMSS